MYVVLENRCKFSFVALYVCSIVYVVSSRMQVAVCIHDIHNLPEMAETHLLVLVTLDVCCNIFYLRTTD